MLKRAMIVQKVAKMCAFVNNVQTRGLLLCARCGRSFTNSHKMLCWILTVSAGAVRAAAPRTRCILELVAKVRKDFTITI